MIVVNYADFISNSQKYVDLAKVRGLKIKAEKKIKVQPKTATNARQLGSSDGNSSFRRRF